MRTELNHLMAPVFNPRELFEDIDTTTPVIVAVSGGSDSVALLHLASSWAKKVAADLLVITVDHGLRPEAAAEAAFVSGISEHLQLQHFTLAWDGMKPTSGISEAAREARYALIAEFARDVGAATILTGHTLDDQAETVWMRNLRGSAHSQFRGLSGMSTGMMLEPGIRVARPLLGYRREALRAYLADIGQTWIEDPSNFDAAFERVRARIALQKSDIGIPEISRFASVCGRWRRCVCEAARDFLVEELEILNGPVFTIDAMALKSQPDELACLVLQVICAMAGGRSHYITSGMAARAAQLESGERMTAGSSIVENRQGRLRVYREFRSLPVLHLLPGENGVWDGRLSIHNNSGKSLICRTAEPADMTALQELGGTPPEIRPKAALRTMPVIVHGGMNLLFPLARHKASGKEIGWDLTVPAIERFCSDYDRALLELVEHVRGALELVQS